MATANLAIAVAAGTILLLTLASGWIKERLWVSEAAVCLLVGVAVGPSGIGMVDLGLAEGARPAPWFEQVARITLAMSVMSAALSLPTGFVRRNWKRLALVLLPGMLAMAAVSGAVAWIGLGLSLPLALLIGAIVAPTDPVLARSVVAGRLAEQRVDDDTRHMIIAESGANDGLALPLVLVPLFLIGAGGALATHPALWTVWEIAAALGLGWAIGKGASHIFAVAIERGFAEEKGLTAITLALVLFTLAAVALAQADGLLAVFVAGLVFNACLAEEHEGRHEHFQDVIDRFLTLPIFILLGAMLPVTAWYDMGWALPATVAALLLLRRLPAWLTLQSVAPTYRDRAAAKFAGWFGPVGVAALFYAVFAIEHGAPEPVWAVVSMVVAASTLMHGISATPLTRRMGGLGRGAERLLRERHHRLRPRFQLATQRGGVGQETLGKIARGGQLGLVERAILRIVLQLRARDLGHPQPHVAEADDAHDVHVVVRAGAEVVGVLHRVLHEPHGRGLLLVERGIERCREIGVLAALGLRDRFVEQLEERLDRRAAVLRQLAAGEVHRLHAVGALVDHRDPAIAHELLHPHSRT